MQRIEEMSDADISEVHESASLFRDVEDDTAGLRGVLDVLTGMRWLTAGMKARERAAFESAIVGPISERPDDAYDLLARGPGAFDAESMGDNGLSLDEFAALWIEAKTVAQGEGFLHWEAAFPGVWQGWQDEQPAGGFDAVIGNPPWDRIKLQEVEWFATRSPELARAPTAAARRAGIKRLRDDGDPLAAEFDAAKNRAEKLGRMVRESGRYPLLSSGDVNLYSLFVERAMALVKPAGMVGQALL